MSELQEFSRKTSFSSSPAEHVDWDLVQKQRELYGKPEQATEQERENAVEAQRLVEDLAAKAKALKESGAIDRFNETNEGEQEISVAEDGAVSLTEWFGPEHPTVKAVTFAESYRPQEFPEGGGHRPERKGAVGLRVVSAGMMLHDNERVAFWEDETGSAVGSYGIRKIEGTPDVSLAGVGPIDSHQERVDEEATAAIMQRNAAHLKEALEAAASNQ